MNDLELDSNDLIKLFELPDSQINDILNKNEKYLEHLNKTFNEYLLHLNEKILDKNEDFKKFFTEEACYTTLIEVINIIPNENFCSSNIDDKESFMFYSLLPINQKDGSCCILINDKLQNMKYNTQIFLTNRHNFNIRNTSEDILSLVLFKFKYLI